MGEAGTINLEYLRFARSVCVLVALGLASGCSVIRDADDFDIGSADGGMAADVGPDAEGGADAGADGDGGAATDAASDAATDAGTDAGSDAGADAGGDAGTDADTDAGAECIAAADCPDRAHIGKDCAGGECVYAGCESGYDDCNSDLTDGCEADLGTSSTCGSCTTSCESDELCDTSGGTPECVLDCSETTCGDLCVDITSNPDHCGGCDDACSVPAGAESATCSDSSCGFVCASGRADCNGSDGDGCEVDTTSDEANCGGCGTACPLASLCSSSRCVPEHDWSVSFGSSDNDGVGGVAIDGSDHTLVAGNFSGTVDFGGGTTRTSAGGLDVFVARYDSTGALDWVVAFGGTGDDAGRDVAVDGSNNVYVTGHYRGTVDFGEGTGRTSNGDNDVYVASFDSTGAFRWVTTFGGSMRNSATAITVDSAGNSYLGGLYEGSMTVGTTDLTAVELFDGWVAAFDDDGVAQWAHSIGGGATQVLTGIALDEGGDLYVAGYFSFHVQPTSGVTHDTAGSFDVFVASFQTDGTYVWSNRYGDTGEERALGIAAGPSGLAVTGWFKGDIDFGGGTMTSAGLGDGFIATFSFAGAHAWSTRFGAGGDDRAVASAFDSSGNLIVSGLARASVDFGGGSLTSAGNADVFVASYDAAGAHRWSRMFGASQYDDSRAVATAGTDFAVAGHLQGTVDFDGGGVTSEGLQDVFVVRYVQ